MSKGDATKILGQYRRAKILELIGKKQLRKSEIRYLLDSCGDPLMKMAAETVDKIVGNLAKDGKLFAQRIKLSNGEGNIYSASRFKPKRHDYTIELPFDTALSSLMGYAVIKPKTRGKIYTEKDSVPSMPAQTHNSKISIQCSMNTVFYGS